MKSIKRIISFLLVALMAISVMKTGSVYSAALSSEEPIYEEPEFLCEYPEPGSRLTVGYSPEGEVRYCWFVDGEAVECEGDTYIPKESDLERFISVEVYDDDELVSTLSVFCSLLPVIYINTEDSAPVVSKDKYINSEIRIQGNGIYNSKTTTLYSGKSEIKGRGNSTWTRFDKKPYKLKLDKKTDLFGMGKSKHWVLLANYIDESLMRNAASVNLAGVFGAEHLDCVWVDVIFNGECAGNYQLFEHARVDENRVNIFDWESAAEDIAKAIKKKDSLSSEAGDAMEEYLVENTQWITSGQFEFWGRKYIISDYYSLPGFNGGIFFESDISYDELSKFRTDNGLPVMIKSPEYLFTNPEGMETAQEIVRRMENAFLSESKMIVEDGEYVSYTDICDFDSLVSYFLTSEMLQNEAGFKSTYFYKDIDEKIVFGPVWDFDFSSNNVSPFGTTMPDRWKTLDTLWFSALTKDPYFAVKARELFIRSYDKLYDFYKNGGILDEWKEYLHASGLKNDEVWHYSRGFEADSEALKQWMSEKTDWIVNEFSGDEAALNSLGGSVSDRLTVSLNAETFSEGYIIKPETESVGVYIDAEDGYDSAVICVNGEYCGRVSLEDGKGTFSADTSLLNEEQGSKNVITVYLVNSDGSLTEKQFVCVTIGDPGENVSVRLLKGETEILNVRKGSYICLTEPDDMTEDMIFRGWSDGLDVIAPGSLYKVSGNTSLRPVYSLCTFSKNTHQLISEDGYLICERCGKIKSADKSLIHVSYLTFDYLRSKYYNYYTGEEVLPKLDIYSGDRLLVEGVDYEIAYKNNIAPGYATFTVKGIGKAGFTGEASLSYRILPFDIKGLTLKVDDVDYAFGEMTPSVSLLRNDKELEEGRDFKVEYSDNAEIGTATVRVTGTGGYTGTKEAKFRILYPLEAVTGLSLENHCNGYIKVSWKPVGDCDGYIVYRKAPGENKYSKAAVIYGKGNSRYLDSNASDGKKYYYKVSSYKKYNGNEYEKMSDSVSLKTDFAHKLVTLTTVATDKKDGSVITKCRVCSSVRSSSVIRKTGKITLSYSTATYTGKALKPKVTVKDSAGNVISSKNYSVSYSSNKNVGTAKVKITFKNNYKGSVVRTFKIVPAAVKKLKASSVKDTSLKLSWDKAKGAVYYKIQRSTDGKKWTTVSTVRGTSASVTKLKPGQSYRFRIVSLDSSKKISGGASPTLKVKTTEP